jgi:hypothetical protein
MKKTLVLGLSIILLAGGSSSCKKGENDPFMLLRSRKARVSGEWIVSSAEIISNSTGWYESSSYDGKTETTTTITNGKTTTETSTYSTTYTFKKVELTKQYTLI